MFNWLVLVLVMFGNFWVWKIFSYNFLIFSLLLILTFALNKFFLSGNKKIFLLAATIFLSLSFFQIQTTKLESLTKLSNDEIRVHDIRKKIYQSKIHFIRILFYRLKLVDFLEGDVNTAIFRLQRNFFETVDPNIYFFSGHPRERVWATEFQKFPFVLIFPFLVGLHGFIVKKKYAVLIFLFPAISLLSFIGHVNNVGPFLLFPFIVLSIAKGSEKILKSLIKYAEK